MTPTKAADTEKVPIEKIDSATRAPEPLEKDVAARDAMTRAAGANPGLPFLPPGDTTGQIPDPNAPSPPAYFNIYSFTVYLKADPSAVPYLGQTANPLGINVRVAAPNVQAAYTAVKTKYAATMVNMIGPCPSFVGADADLSTSAGALSAPAGGTQQAKPLQSTNPRKSHSSWD